MGISRVEDLKYRFEWTWFQFRPKGCSSQKSRLPSVVIAPADSELRIRFPEYFAAAKRITLTAFPKDSLNGEHAWRLFGGPTFPWPNTRSRMEFPKEGFFWMDVELDGRPPYMGWLHRTTTEARSVRAEYMLNTTPPLSPNLQYMVKLRDHALEAAASDQTEGSPSKAFRSFAIETPCKTSATRAYLVDWALAERRTGLKFASMKAFKEWAAQRGLTVMGVVDAPDGGGDERASESEAESETEGEE